MHLDYTVDYERSTAAALEGNRACLTTEVEKLDFASVDFGEEETKTVTATNCGVPNFELRPFIGGMRTSASPSTRDAPEYEPFTVVDEEDFPVEVAGGESTEVEVKYSPTEDPKWDYFLRLTALIESDGFTSPPKTVIELDHGFDLSGDPIDCSDYDTNQREEC